jgi:hypothetical protein
VSISNTIERSPFGDSVIITVTASGQHHGRNGYARIKGLQVWYRRNGTVFLDSVNSRDTITVGGFHNVPVTDLLRLLELLEAEVEKGFPPPESTGDSRT